MSIENQVEQKVEFEVKNHPRYPMYEFNSNGLYKKKDAVVWKEGILTSKGEYKAKMRDIEVIKTVMLDEVLYEAFNDALTEDETVKHLNGDLKDNRIENLEKCERPKKLTRKEIMKDLRKNTYKQQKRICATNIETGEKLYFVSKGAAGKYYGISAGTIYYICEGKMKPYKGKTNFTYDIEKAKPNEFKKIVEVPRKHKENCLTTEQRKDNFVKSMLKYYEKKLQLNALKNDEKNKQV